MEKNSNSEEKQNDVVDDVVLAGSGAIVKRLARSFMELHEWWVLYGFPMKQNEGNWYLSMNELSAWVKKWGEGLPFEKITSEVLRIREKYLNIMALPKKDRKLTGINAIEKFMKKQPCDLLDLKNIFGFPMIRTDGIYCMSLDDLYEWMAKYGIKDPHEVSYSKIEPLFLKHRENDIPDKIHSGDMNKICEVLSIATGTFIDYLKYDPCPIRKIPGTDSAPKYEVRKKDWLEFCYMREQEAAEAKKNALNADSLKY